jgi:predicted DNA-binding transcriptional regulator YafY
MSKITSVTRLAFILDKLNNGKKLNIEHLSYEYDVSTRTIRRDLELIEEVWPKFLLKDGENFYSVQKNILNNVLMGNDLATLTSVLDIFKNSGVKFNLNDNMKKMLTNGKRVYKLDTKPFEELKNRDILHNLEQAIEYRQHISFTYIKDETINIFKVKPYKIAFLNENFYLASVNSETDEFLLSRISLIKEVVVDSKTFYINPQLDNFISKIQTPWARYVEGSQNEVKVVVIANQSISRYFKMKKYLPSQKILQEFDNGDLELEFTVSNLKEIEELIIKWLPKLRVVSPMKLNSIIKKLLLYKLKGIPEEKSLNNEN